MTSRSRTHPKLLSKVEHIQKWLSLLLDFPFCDLEGCDDLAGDASAAAAAADSAALSAANASALARVPSSGKQVTTVQLGLLFVDRVFCVRAGVGVRRWFYSLLLMLLLLLPLLFLGGGAGAGVVVGVASVLFVVPRSATSGQTARYPRSAASVFVGSRVS